MRLAFTRMIYAARLRSAASEYARLLGPCLLHDYGASTQYTKAQIERAVSKCELSRRFIQIGYAAFISEQKWQVLGLPEAEREALRRLFFSRVKTVPNSGFVPAEPNAYALSGNTPSS